MTHKRTGMDKFEKYLAIFVAIDICLFPYIRQVRSLPSMLLLVVWYVLNFRRLKINKEFIAFILTLLAIVASCCVGVVVLPKTVPSYATGTINILNNTISYSVIYIYVFLYYFFFRTMMQKHQITLKKVLRVLYLIICIFAVYYIVSPAGFYAIRNFWTMSGEIQEASLDLSTYYRYTFSFSDPNNIAIMTVAIMIVMFEEHADKEWLKYVALFGCLIVLLASMSTQGIIAFALYAVIKVAQVIMDALRGKKNVSRTTVYVMLVAAIAMCIAIPLVLENEVVSLALGRMSGNSGSFSMRFEIWKNLLKGKNLLYYLLVGNGCTVVLDGKAVSTHNGHLYLIFAYGAIAYVAFMYIFFRKKKHVAWQDWWYKLPLLICFTINVGLIDARYSFAMAMLSAIGCHSGLPSSVWRTKKKRV